MLSLVMRCGSSHITQPAMWQRVAKTEIGQNVSPLHVCTCISSHLFGLSSDVYVPLGLCFTRSAENVWAVEFLLNPVFSFVRPISCSCGHDLQMELVGGVRVGDSWF